MSDLLREVNLLRYYHISEEMLRDKDHLKNLAHSKYEEKVVTFMVVPFIAQFWQLSVTGHPESLARYK